MICTQKAQFNTYVSARTAKLPEFRRRRKLNEVLTTLLMRTRFARENFTSGQRRRPISFSMLEVPTYEALFADRRDWRINRLGCHNTIVLTTITFR